MWARRRGADDADGAPRQHRPLAAALRRAGAELRYLEVDERGELSLDQLDRELERGDVKLVAFTHVSNVLGTILPVAEMTARVRAAGAVSLVDGAQAVPHLPVDASALGADFYAWTGHKALGPTGIGVLHGRAEILEEMQPFMTGGDMIASVDFEGATWNELPYKFEAGTPLIAEAVGLGAAVDYLVELGMERVRAHERELTGYMLERLREVPGLRFVGPPEAEDAAGSCRSRSKACTHTTSPSLPTAAGCASGPGTTARSR